MKKISTTIVVLLTLLLNTALANTPSLLIADLHNIEGTVTDAQTNDPIIGAVIIVKDNPAKAVATDIDGNFILQGIELPTTIVVNYAGSKTQEILVQSAKDKLNIALEADVIALESVQVVRRRKQNTETAMIAALRQTNAVAVGISSAQISKTSDSDAGEVVRRIPGISLIDSRFIVVRGLAQRYNNVWLNGGGLPSTEADGRAFSFDVIPSSCIDNIIISKSFTADLPGDFSGGFIQVISKGMPDESSVKISLGTGINSQTQFQSATLGSRSSTEWLGFDNSLRPLSSDFPSDLRTVSDTEELNKLFSEGFNQDWATSNFTPTPDIKASVQWNERINDKLGMVFTFNYENKYKTITDMQNDRYGLYNTLTETSVLENAFTDNQYSQETNISAMNNWVYQKDENNRFEFRNLFNITGTNRYTDRIGYDYTGTTDTYNHEVEYMYSSRLSYTGQLAGNHKFGDDKTNLLDWNATYSYANMSEPDRRVVNESKNGDPNEDGSFTPTRNEIRRYYRDLDDNIFSGGVNYKKDFRGGNWMPTLKAGLYSEYRSRQYTPRRFAISAINDPTNADAFADFYTDDVEVKMSDKWIGTDPGQYMFVEDGFYSDAYSGDYYIGAAYTQATLPIGKFIIDLGVRMEYWNMTVDYNDSATSQRVVMKSVENTELSILPALNVSYNINTRHTLRASYGRTVNRPEFREVSPSIYYDFELDAEMTGNTELQMATIDNVDLRYEFYPKSGEIISIGAFYKHFIDPIEWTFTQMGDNSYRYSYENAESAYTAGVELDIRKTFDFIGVPELALVFNGAYIVSEVEFSEDDAIQQRSRPLQGQSPYIVNVGMYYDSGEKLGLSASLLYNIIGERIVGIGKTLSNDNPDAYLPDSYEMPRSMLDFTIAKKFAKRYEVKLGLKNLLNSPVEITQIATYTDTDGVYHEIEQVTKKYYEGISASLSFSMTF
ncbi:MAG: TonB-dependent receptor [Rikenellaceae bacterium]